MFNNQSFPQDFEIINWNQVHCEYFNLNSHAPLKKLNKKQRKFQQKPWITKGIQNAIEKKNRLFKNYIKCGDSNKNIFHQVYKTYRNSLSTLLRRSKKSYYNNYFRNNINNIKNTWKGIKSTLKNLKNLNLPKGFLTIRMNFLLTQIVLPTNLITFFVLLHLLSTLI